MLLHACRKRALACLRKFRERVLAVQGAAIGKYPCGVALNALVLANLRLPLAVGSGTLDIRQVFGGGAKHRLGLLAVRTPKCAIKDGAAFFQTLCKRVELVGLSRRDERRRNAGHNERNNDPPKDEYAFLHPDEYIIKHLVYMYATITLASYRLDEFFEIFFAVINREFFARANIAHGVDHDVAILDARFTVGLAVVIDEYRRIVWHRAINCPFLVENKQIP